MQSSKTIYFSDYSSAGKSKCGVTVPFSDADLALYEAVKPLSSYTLRNVLGCEKFLDLERFAAKQQVSVSTYVREALRRKIPVANGSDGAFYKIQSTFQGGKGSPLHDWYPYLEGYSPEFVESIIEKFCPTATDILDPFCGSGTTVIAAAKRGGRGFYSEVNPVCQFVIKVKLKALRLNYPSKVEVSSSLLELSESFSKRVAKYEVDKRLKESFGVVFGGRPFFDDLNYEMILKSRSFLNDLYIKNLQISDFVQIAMLRSLVPSSLLIRRGDLRFKNPAEIARGRVSFLDEVASGLRLIASDLMDLSSVAGDAYQLIGDARGLCGATQNKMHALITSPPYLNGTNYFRNTKIELWFLGELNGKSDLRRFRDSAITSGINDVTQNRFKIAKNNRPRFSSNLLKKTLLDVEGVAYDQRIPVMVENYFYDMHDVFHNISTIMSGNGILAIDLGDSVYGGVHVKTQEILAEMMDFLGYTQTEYVVLRERQSRSGTKLSQTLQVFNRSDRNQSTPWEI